MADLGLRLCHYAKFISEKHITIHMGMMRGAAKEAGREARRRTGCGFLPEVIQFLGKDLEREMSSRTRDFYGFVLPPVDMYRDEDQIRVHVDLPGFSKDQIRIKLEGNVLRVSACRDAETKDAVYTQRPASIEKRIRLPAHIKRGEEPECPAALQDGVLTVTIPVPSGGRDIAIG